MLVSFKSKKANNSIFCYSIWVLAPRTISIYIRETIYSIIHFPKYNAKYMHLEIYN